MSLQPYKHQTTYKSQPERNNLAYYLRIAKVCFACVFILLIGIGIHKLVYYKAGSAIPEIKSGIAGYCIDDLHNALTSHTVVANAPCNGRASQNWMRNGTAIVHQGAYCLTVQRNDTSTTGYGVFLDTCDNTSQQIWMSAIGGYENPATKLCLATSNEALKQQLVLASCKYLTEPSETWAAATWHAHDAQGAVVTCMTGSEGDRVACQAAKQWVIWQAGAVQHTTLLNEYSDGNGYEEWCADFVSYVYKAAGYPFDQGERQGWDEYVADAVQYENFTYHPAGSYIPQPGDVAYFNYPGGHVEIVVIGGVNPLFIYGDSGTTDPSTRNGDMAENSITNDPAEGHVLYYLSPN